MAENKKGFMLYADQKTLFNKLPDEIAGKLIKHIMAYVNDEDPKTDDLIIDIAFEPIKMQLKRDLIKWEQRAENSRINGAKGGRPREDKKPTGLNGNPTEPKKPDTVNVTVKDTVNVKDIYKTILLSDLKKSDFEDQTYFDITLSFYELFKKNITDAGGSISTLEKANGKWIDQIRLMIEVDKQTIENVRAVWQFLNTNEFWKKNILSAAKLREKFNTLLLNSKENGKTGKFDTEEYSIEGLKAVLKKHEIT